MGFLTRLGRSIQSKVLACGSAIVTKAMMLSEQAKRAYQNLTTGDVLEIGGTIIAVVGAFVGIWCSTIGGAIAVVGGLVIVAGMLINAYERNPLSTLSVATC